MSKAKTKRKNRYNSSNIKIKKRSCPIDAAGIKIINYKDVEFLKAFLTDGGKILPRRITGVSFKNQKKLTLAIKQARNAALLSFADGYIPQNVMETYQQNLIKKNSNTVAAQEENI